jgi:twitching motility two-component system response regulator PilH
MKVLVVDDNPMQRQLIAKVLEKTGLRVTVAGDGIEAVEKVQHSCPDLVVLDIVMPRMNGYEVCRWLKSNVGSDLPIVMCSSKTEPFDSYWGMKQGADAYLTKPFQAQDLVSTVLKLLRVVR